MPAVASLVMLFSVLVPTKMWYAPGQPINITVKSEGEVTLMLTDFAGKAQDPKGSADVAGGKEVDIKPMFPSLATPGTYVLWAVPKGKTIEQFVGTPLVIGVRTDKRPNMPNPNEVIVTRVEPLRYAVMTTDKGAMTLAFYYDSAPNTADSFLRLSEQGFYDGLTFHRIIPGFVIQGGDPLGNGLGGPGFSVGQEFNDRKHVEGVLSMARSGDPQERQGLMPGHEAANSAGSQFFICLGNVARLDGRYTAFGEVVDGLAAVKAIAAVPLADADAGKPVTAPVIKTVEVKTVVPGSNPYAKIINVTRAGNE